jgi:tRNA threonylcarbamoyl adenosine modification protein YeaZ
MVNILSVDTSSEATSCCVNDGAKANIKFEKNKNSHAESLFRLIGEAIDASAVNMPDIEYFAVATGPGSYTGVRIGLSAVKGLAFGKGRQVLGISKFDILAYISKVFRQEFVVCFDGKREEIFCQKFYNDENIIKSLSEPYIIKASELSEINMPKVMLAKEAAQFEAKFIEIEKVDAKDIAEYAEVIINQGRAEEFPAAPLYIRNPDYVKVTNLRS